MSTANRAIYLASTMSYMLSTVSIRDFTILLNVVLNSSSSNPTIPPMSNSDLNVFHSLPLFFHFEGFTSSLWSRHGDVVVRCGAEEVFSELPSTSQGFVSLCFWSGSVKNASHFPTCLAEARLEEKRWGMFLPQQERQELARVPGKLRFDKNLAG